MSRWLFTVSWNVLGVFGRFFYNWDRLREKFDLLHWFCNVFGNRYKMKLSVL